MGLDVHITREEDEPWGFRLIGGVDFGMPLTVVKVFPNSPAEKAGLHHGDVVIRANGVDAVDMTHDESRAVVASAKDRLTLGVTRGLYDPVLDDTEPIYEPIDLEDFDQPSQPTEVTLPDILEKLNGLPDFLLTPKLSESRSLTASPFPNQTKPYRPFSTEPLVVPPLEDPIILNPDYRDVFDKLDIDEDFLPKTKFKLPISEQYDPDGTKQKVTVKIGEEEVTEDMREVMLKTEVKFMEEMKKDIDLEKIELTASSIVDDSIEKAVNVAEEIKKEIDVELHESIMSFSESKSIMETKVSKQATESSLQEETINVKSEIDENKRSELKKSKEAANEVNELVELIDKTTKEIVKQNDKKSEVNVAKEVASFESVDIKHEAVDERKLSSKQEIDETIIAGSVKSKSAIYDKERDVTDKKAVKETKYVEEKVKDGRVQRDIKQNTTAQSSVKGGTKTDSKMSTAKLLSEQRAYTIGLQTIPNIRGTIHSSHFDMLLKTFFIHLTDVMVALSRFILLEPELKTEEKEDVVSERTVTETLTVGGEERTYDSYESRSAATQMAKNEERQIKNEVLEKRQHSAEKEVVESHINREVTEDRIQEHAEDFLDEVVEKRILSGAKMAQLTEKRSEELMQKMGAVVTEFQTKAGIDDTDTEDLGLQQRRSRSRSKANETGPSEIFLKKSEEVTEIKTSASEMSSSVSESKEIKKIESEHESRNREVKSSKNQDGKTTYIAIVEAHVYTNKDSILDEQLTEFSETSSMQSADETNIALETNEAMSTEQVALKSEQISREVAKTSIEEKKDLSAVSNAKKQDSVQIFEQTSDKIEKVHESAVKQTEVEFDSKSVIRKQEVTAEEIIKPRTESQGVESLRNESMQTVVTVSKDKDSTTESKMITKEGAKMEIYEEKDAVAVIQVSETVKKEVMADATDKAFVESIAAKEETMSSVVETKNSDEVEKDTFAALKITKEEIKEVSQDLQIANETDLTIHNQVEVAEENKTFVSKVEEKNKAKSFESQEIKESAFSAKLVESKQAKEESSFIATVQEEASSVIAESHQKVEQESSFVAKSLASQQIQESSFIAKSVSEVDTQKLSLKTDIAQKKFDTQSVQIDEYIDTPTPSTIPPTPLTDEYVFKLEIPLPKQLETPVPRDCSPPSEHEDEDPHIVKKKLVPHIDTKVEEGVIFDPPLPTPPGSKVTSPVYTKPGLRGGMERPLISKEEILEIERKSTLLTSAIDETIKSIEAYKEEVGIETKEENKADTHSEECPIVYNGYAKVVETKVFDPKEKFNEDLALSPAVITSDDIEVPQNTKLEKEVSTKQVETKVEMNASEEVIKSEDMEKKDHLEGYRPIQFDPEEIQSVKRELRSIHLSNNTHESIESHQRQAYMTETGEIIGTHQGIVDGLEEAVVDSEVARELGKPGMTEEKIAELISGESEMLREAHVMGLSRVISAHMHRPDDSSVDFKKIKPIVDSLKDSEVLKALNDELMKTKEEQKKEERKWTKFLQKPKRAVPTAKCGYYGSMEPEEEVKEAYKVKIVKQPKPKVAPDYKPEDFNTGLLPWEERALREPTPPPVEAEDPILIPEEAPEILEAVDPLPETEVPDLEDSGIPLPPPEEKEATPPPAEEEDEVGELDIEAVIEETEKIVEENLVEEMDQGKIAEQLMMSVQNMVDPNASLDQQLAQMRAQLAALAQLPCVIQQSLEMVTRQLSQLSQLESKQTVQHQEEESLQMQEENEVTQTSETIEETAQEMEEKIAETATEETLEIKQSVTAEELERMRKEEEEMLEEQRRLEKQKKELMEQARIEHESRQVKQRSTPRVGKPKPVFGPATPQERPVVLPGGRRWRNPKDAYNEQFIAETLAAQAEIIQGKAKGLSYESVRLPYDERINFMKYEKPPVSLDHLQHSDVYKLVHNMEHPIKRVDMLTPVIAECDYREKCRSVTPCNARMAMEEHLDIPQQVQP